MEHHIKAPLIFSCLKCRTIVGDSYAFVSSNREINIVTLSAASNIGRSQEVYTSKAGPDIGSTYFNFMCTQCHVNLGRYYITTSSDLDNLRDKFSFLVDEISSYELGKAQIGKIPDLDVDESVTSQKEPVNPPISSCSTCGALSEEILKVQQVVISIIERLDRLEGPDVDASAIADRKRSRN